jgi:hypothetical protein
VIDPEDLETEIIEIKSRLSALEGESPLRAAAPDLLAALEQAYSDICRFLNEGDFKTDVEWDAGYIVDALAKAKGEK